MDNQKIYDKAKEYLLSFPEINNEILNNHLNYWKGKKPKDLKELFKKMVFHSTNRQSMPNVIGDIDKLSSYIYNWNYEKVNDKYKSWEELFDTIKSSSYVPPGKMLKNNSHGLWVQFFKSIISISLFVSRFKNIEEFNKFVETFYFNEETRIALPLLIKEEIFGYQFALACDFLKENGYPEFIKPDVHIIDIFKGLKLTTGNNDFQIFRDVIKFSKSINKLPYEIDKLFWLIGSGKFYLNNIKIKTSKEDFINSIINI
ncbi:MAG: hypothetical protein PHY59_07140 [Methanobacterium sp.]|nr:hypothetical protein [Methanobacterium sp.]